MSENADKPLEGQDATAGAAAGGEKPAGDGEHVNLRVVSQVLLNISTFCSCGWYILLSTN